MILVVSTDDVKYFGNGLKDGVRPEVKWTKDALGKAMSLVLEIKYYSYENELGLDGQGVMSKNSEEIVKVRLDKMGNVTNDDDNDDIKDVNVLNCDRLKNRCFKTRTMLDCNLYFACLDAEKSRNRSSEEEKVEKKAE